MSDERRPRPTVRSARQPRLRANVGQPTRERVPGRQPASSMVRPTLRTILRQSIINGKLGALILLIAGVFGFGYIFRAERFVVRGVTVSGARSVEAAEIKRLAAVTS